MDYNAIDQWYTRDHGNGCWSASNDHTGASIFCNGEAVAKAVRWYYEEMTELGLCDEVTIEEAERTLVEYFRESTIRESWYNAREELEYLRAEL